MLDHRPSLSEGHQIDLLAGESARQGPPCASQHHIDTAQRHTGAQTTMASCAKHDNMQTCSCRIRAFRPHFNGGNAPQPIALTHARISIKTRANVPPWAEGMCSVRERGEGKRRQGSGGGRLTFSPSSILRASILAFRARGRWASVLVAHLVRLTCRVAKGGMVSVSDAR